MVLRLQYKYDYCIDKLERLKWYQERLLYSRRIDEKNRIVYEVFLDSNEVYCVRIVILQISRTLLIISIMTQPFDLRIIDGVSLQTIRFFKRKKRVKEFLDLVAECGSVALASSKWKLSPLEVQEIITKDPTLRKLITASLRLALEIAEGVLYERAVNGYIEETITDGVKTGEKKKYSDSCLLSYLRANSGKYASVKISNKTPRNIVQGNDIEIPTFTESEDI